MENFTQHYTERANKLKTRKQLKQQDEAERIRQFQSGGLSQQEYWKRFVKSKADVVTFYQTFFPEYPLQLAEAIAERVDRIIQKNHNGQKLTEQELKYFSYNETAEWDFKAEMKQHELAGKMQVAVKRLEELKFE